MKVLVALVMPALIVCLADWQLRVRTKAIEQDDERVRQLPRTRQR